MIGLYFDKKLALKKDMPLPARKIGEALVRILKAGVCNTDIEITKGYMGFKGIPGHEFVGIVEASSDEKSIGRRVVGEINLGCGKCEYCVKGLGNHCPARSVLGIVRKDGCFAEYITLPERNLHPVPDTVTNEEAVFTEPLAACLEVLGQVKIEQNSKAAVIGDGKLGILMAQVVQLRSGNSILVGKHDIKLKTADKLGINTVNKSDKKQMNAINKSKWDIVIDCSGSPAGLEEAMQIVRPRGTIVLKSTVADSYKINLASIVINEVTVVGSRCGPFAEALKLLAKKKIKVAPLISHVFRLNEGLKAMKAAKERDVIKILIDVENSG